MRMNKIEWRIASPHTSLKQWLVEKYCGYKYTLYFTDQCATAAKASAIIGKVFPEFDAKSRAFFTTHVFDTAPIGKRVPGKGSTSYSKDGKLGKFRVKFCAFKTYEEAQTFVNSLGLTDTQKTQVKIGEL
ncbi:MAG: hypothetical protein MJZ37_08850 [Bacilli bacterium]|nr:hypothetical protein [Bacilli bacterium]